MATEQFHTCIPRIIKSDILACRETLTVTESQYYTTSTITINSSHEVGEGGFVSSELQMFCIGNIVQVQLSFVVIYVKGGRRKMLTVLRLIALLDGTFSKVRKGWKCYERSKTLLVALLQIANAQTSEQAPSKMQTLKRRIGYDEVNNNAESRNEKQNKMVVDESVRASVTN